MYLYAAQHRRWYKIRNAAKGKILDAPKHLNSIRKSSGSFAEMLEKAKAYLLTVLPSTEVEEILKTPLF